MRKDGYERPAIAKAKTDFEKQAWQWFNGVDGKFMQRADERLNKITLAYQLHLEDQQRYYQKVNGD